MKILVPVKRVVDYNVKIRVKPDGSGVDLANVKMAMNPFDEIAVEEALRQKEAGKATEVIVVSIGPAAGRPRRLRNGLAMGADRGILVKVDGTVEPLTVAKILHRHLCKAEAPGLVIMGKQAIDDDCNQTGQMLAALERLGPGHLRVQARDRGRRAPRSPARSTAARRRVTLKLPADRDDRPQAQRAALRQPPQHHEGQEEADRGEGAGRLRGRRDAAPHGVEHDRAPGPQGRCQGRLRR